MRVLLLLASVAALLLLACPSGAEARRAESRGTPLRKMQPKHAAAQPRPSAPAAAAAPPSAPFPTPPTSLVASILSVTMSEMNCTGRPVAVAQAPLNQCTPRYNPLGNPQYYATMPLCDPSSGLCTTLFYSDASCTVALSEAPVEIGVCDGNGGTAFWHPAAAPQTAKAKAAAAAAAANKKQKSAAPSTKPVGAPLVGSLLTYAFVGDVQCASGVPTSVVLSAPVGVCQLPQYVGDRAILFSCATGASGAECTFSTWDAPRTDCSGAPNSTEAIITGQCLSYPAVAGYAEVNVFAPAEAQAEEQEKEQAEAPKHVGAAAAPVSSFVTVSMSNSNCTGSAVSLTAQPLGACVSQGVGRESWSELSCDASTGLCSAIYADDPWCQERTQPSPAPTGLCDNEGGFAFWYQAGSHAAHKRAEQKQQHVRALAAGAAVTGSLMTFQFGDAQCATGSPTPLASVPVGVCQPPPFPALYSAQYSCTVGPNGAVCSYSQWSSPNADCSGAPDSTTTVVTGECGGNGQVMVFLPAEEQTQQAQQAQQQLEAPKQRVAAAAPALVSSVVTLAWSNANCTGEVVQSTAQPVGLCMAYQGENPWSSMLLCSPSNGLCADLTFTDTACQKGVPPSPILTGLCDNNGGLQYWYNVGSSSSSSSEHRAQKKKKIAPSAHARAPVQSSLPVPTGSLLTYSFSDAACSNASPGAISITSVPVGVCQQPPFPSTVAWQYSCALNRNGAACTLAHYAPSDLACAGAPTDVRPIDTLGECWAGMLYVFVPDQ